MGPTLVMGPAILVTGPILVMGLAILVMGPIPAMGLCMGMAPTMATVPVPAVMGATAPIMSMANSTAYKINEGTRRMGLYYTTLYTVYTRITQCHATRT